MSKSHCIVTFITRSNATRRYPKQMTMISQYYYKKFCGLLFRLEECGIWVRHATIAYYHFLQRLSPRSPKKINFPQDFKAFIRTQAAEYNVSIVHILVLSKCYLKQRSISIRAHITHRNTARTCVPQYKIFILESI